LNDGLTRESLLNAGADMVIRSVPDLLQHLKGFPTRS
jgi:phosphoglycolate phosphatase-like HAD superfamily hydrolase